MSRQPRQVAPFAYLLPIAELLLCWTLLPIADPSIGREIGRSVHPIGPIKTLSTADRSYAAFLANSDWQLSASQTIWLVNVPGVVAEFVTSIPSWPDTWFPSGFPNLFAWRAAFLPFTAMPFWYAVGAGVDWFVRRREGGTRIGRIALMLAGSAFLFCGVMAIVGLTDDDPSLRSPDLSNAMGWSGLVWVALSTIPCWAGVLQWRKTRAQRRAANVDVEVS